ncbi:hypothetical protein MP228_012071 [Amoeboaphelidium protococcarum]|nr:hypothetical protein MP228_012071 [Amoeboaphelidium protococcarum]
MQAAFSNLALFTLDCAHAVQLSSSNGRPKKLCSVYPFGKFNAANPVVARLMAVYPFYLACWYIVLYRYVLPHPAFPCIKQQLSPFYIYYMRLVIKLNAFVYESDSVPISCVICALDRGG